MTYFNTTIMDNQKRLKEIEIQLEKVEKEIKNREKTDPNQGWQVYCQHMQPVWDKHNKLDREYRMLMTPEFGELSTYGDMMSLESFIENVKCGGFIDSDGSGNYVRDNKESNIMINPSDVRYDSIRTDFDTIIWFNK